MTSSSGDRGRRLNLTVVAEQQATTLAVVDHAWRVVARGIGKVFADLPPGLYKIEARLSRSKWSDYVSLRDAPETITVPSFGIKSAVPFSNGTRTHEYHEAQLNMARNRVDLDKGRGARILLMARNWSPSGTENAGLPQMRLERWRGDDIADLTTDGKIDTTSDAVGTCSITVNPGTYLVSVETPCGRISQSVYARAGWDTQVFVLQDFTMQQTGRDTMTVPPTISVTQAIVKTAEADLNEVYQLIEVGQSALSERRLALGKAVFDSIASRKFNAPILGLLAAHILLLAEDKGLSGQSDAQLVTFDRHDFETILRNTAELLGDMQPDVLALRTRSTSFPPPTDIEVATPPIFLMSWELLLGACQNGYSSILPERLWRRVRGRTNLAPHFAWGRAESMFAAQSRATERRLFKSLTAATVRAASATKDTPTTTGKVKWFDATKGFGFIAPDGRSKDVFVHFAAVERSGLTGLKDAQRVTFDIETGRDGRESAINLSLGEMPAAPQSLGRQPTKTDDLEALATTGVAEVIPTTPDHGPEVTGGAADQPTSRNTWDKPDPKDLASFAPRFALDRMVAAAKTPEEAATQVARQFGLPPAATAKWLDKAVFDRLRAQVQK